MSKHVTAEKHASQQSDLYHGLLNLSRFMTRIHIKINIKVNYTHTCAHHGLWWSGHLNVRTCRFRTRIHIKNKHQSDFHPYLCPSWPVQSKCQNKLFQDNNPHKNQNQSDFHHIGAHHGLLNLNDRTCLFRTKININYANIGAHHGLLNLNARTCRFRTIIHTPKMAGGGAWLHALPAATHMRQHATAHL